ncbi:COPI associated protein [Seminavis robusta]|uniref:COPI associated protein n=2 Tax=Seminavis robusta TaxID=568900 RepID=A0A9N8E4W5_9STRA|nr:COPI associated protein [Seminavis robusta]|eukprot:Sro545_g163760.1 COPI associated protein (462) ;mRNA; r:1853-3238
MKQIDADPSFQGDDPEMIVDGSQSMSEPIVIREDPPEPTLSLSPKSSRSGKEKRKQRKQVDASVSRGSNGASPTNTRSPPRSPRSMDINSDVSREPPESIGRGVSEERFVSTSQKGAEPPALESPTVQKKKKKESSVDRHHQDAPGLQTNEEIEKLATPHEFKKSKSMKSTKSGSGSRRSASRRRKMRVMEITSPVEVVAESNASSSLYGVFNGHLMKWRFEAEEGGPFIRVPAFFGATALVTTTTYALIFDPNTWTILSIVLSLFIYAISLLCIVLEGRFMCTNPLGIRAHLRSALTRRNRVFRFVWGRGILYIIAGGLSCALILIPSLIAGGFMALVGFSAVVFGAYSARMFYKLRDSLKDDDYLGNAFNRFDYDKDGFITLPEFVNLLSMLGMDIDDRIGIKAFHAADVNHEYKISQEAFMSWWKGAFLKNGKSPRLDDINSELGTDEEEGSAYHRMG